MTYNAHITVAVNASQGSGRETFTRAAISAFNPRLNFTSYSDTSRKHVSTAAWVAGSALYEFWVLCSGKRLLPEFLNKDYEPRIVIDLIAADDPNPVGKAAKLQQRYARSLATAAARHLGSDSFINISAAPQSDDEPMTAAAHSVCWKSAFRQAHLAVPRPARLLVISKSDLVTKQALTVLIQKLQTATGLEVVAVSAKNNRSHVKRVYQQLRLKALVRYGIITTEQAEEASGSGCCVVM